MTSEIIENLLCNDNISLMEKMLIIQENKEEISDIDYVAAMLALKASSHYCASCGIYYRYDKCEVSEISKELECHSKEDNINSLFSFLTKPKTKTLTVHTIKCPLGHKAILDHSEV